MGPSRLAPAVLGAAILLTTGCGASSEPPTISQVVDPPIVTVAPAPPKPSTTPQQATNGHPADPPPATDAAYVAALVQLSHDLDAEIDTAEKSGDSAAIGRVLERLDQTISGWTDAGHPAGAGAAALSAAGQTARSNVESPLELDEARRQVAAARAALGG
jgi:hypothetical protein